MNIGFDNQIEGVYTRRTFYQALTGLFYKTLFSSCREGFESWKFWKKLFNLCGRKNKAWPASAVLMGAVVELISIE